MKKIFLLILTISSIELFAMKRKAEETDSSRNVQAKVDDNTCEAMSDVDQTGSNAIIENLISVGKESTLEKKSETALDSLTKLIEFAIDGDLNKLNFELAKPNVDLNQKDKFGNTALHYAALNNHAKIVKILLQKNGIDKNARDNEGLTPLAIAVNNGNLKAVELLLSDRKELIKQISQLHLQLKKISAEEEIEKNLTKIKVNKQELLQQLTISDNLLRKDVVVDTQDARINYTPLLNAVKSGHTEIVQALLEAGANPTKIIESKNKILTPLDLSKDNKEISDLLQAKKAEFADRAYEFMENISGKRKLEIALKILQRGIDVNAKESLNGLSPLLVIAQESNNLETNYLELAQILIDSKADVNEKDNLDCTILMYAIRRNQKGLVKMLIDAKADIKASCFGYGTPLERALFENKSEIAQLLIAAKADIPSWHGQLENLVPVPLFRTDSLL